MRFWLRLCWFDAKLERQFRRPAASLALHRYQDLSGRAADETRPDEYSSFDREPRAFPGSSARGVRRDNSCRILNRRVGRKSYFEIRRGRCSATLGRVSQENGISHSLGLLAGRSAARQPGADAAGTAILGAQLVQESGNSAIVC